MLSLYSVERNLFCSSSLCSSQAPCPQVPDPARTHVLWGLSKDFGLAGFRVGFIHSHNADLIRCLDGMSFYTSASVHIQQVE